MKNFHDYRKSNSKHMKAVPMNGEYFRPAKFAKTSHWAFVTFSWRPANQPIQLPKNKNFWPSISTPLPARALPASLPADKDRNKQTAESLQPNEPRAAK
jgi:hypothetical protein